jgi:perosamine synthetase
MSNIGAALGLAQIGKIDRLIDMRRDNADYMIRRLSAIEGVSFLKPDERTRSVYQMFPVRIKGRKEDRDRVQQYLADKGILTRVYFYPIHLSRFYGKAFGYRKGELPVTETVSEQVLSLPMYPSLKKREIDYIAHQLDRCFQV